jgi:hypothetical protein
MTQLEEAINLLDRATTILYNLEGDAYQAIYEDLEKIVEKLKGEQQ